MRSLVLIVVALGVLLAGCGGHGKPSLHVTPLHRLTACASSDCGGYAVTVRWGVFPPWGHATTGYNVFCTLSGSACNGTPYGTTTGTSFTVTGMDCGTTFQLGVQAHDGSGNTSQIYTTPYTTAACSAQTLNCFNAPGACGYPDPNYRGGNVGVANCAGLAHQLPSSPAPTTAQLDAALGAGTYFYSGSGNVLEVAASTVTWQNINFANWSISVGTGANTLTLNNDCVSLTGNGSGQVIVQDQATGPDTGQTHTLTLENSTVFDTSTASASSVSAAVGAPVDSLVNNDYIYNADDGVNIGTNSTIGNSYILTNPVITGAHAEPIYLATNGTLTVNHNTLLNPLNQTADVFGQSALGPCATSLTITNNLLTGGGYILYACSGSTSQGSSVLDFEKNDFARCLGGSTSDVAGGSYCGSSDPCTGQEASCFSSAIGNGADTHGYWPNGGFFNIDATTYCTGVTWSGNFWDDNGATVGC